jgi:hypothetical protein
MQCKAIHKFNSQADYIKQRTVLPVCFLVVVVMEHSFASLALSNVTQYRRMRTYLFLLSTKRQPTKDRRTKKCVGWVLRKIMERVTGCCAAILVKELCRSLMSDPTGARVWLALRTTRTSTTCMSVRKNFHAWRAARTTNSKK